jgi:hypothetical protein
MTTKVGVEQADMAAQVLNDAVAQVAASPGLSSRKYNGIISAATTQLRQAVGKQMVAQRKKQGRPTRFTEKLGSEICRRISEGETLKSICKDLNLHFENVLEWTEDHKSFGEAYIRARRNMAINMVDGMIENVAVLENDRALAARVQADVVRWTAQRFAPEMFADSKRIELKGEVTHTHIHSLEDHQKRKIAEAWLMSQQDDSPGISAETSGPDLEAVAVREICETEQGVPPKRKRTSTPQLPDPKRKRGRKPRIDMDKPIDSVS